VITLEQFWMGRDAEYASELTEEIRANAQITVDKTNQLLDRANTGSVHVLRSGWRPRAVNAATDNAATASKHLTGEAVDIADDDRALADYCAANQADLVEIGLWCEDFRWTPTWVHFQIIPPRSGKRIYIPSLAKPLDPAYPVNWT
jgi:hypothetical protein